MKNKMNTQGFTTGKFIALLLVAAMILTLGVTAAASADNGEDEEITIVEAEELIVDDQTIADDDSAEITVIDEDTLIKAAEDAKESSRVNGPRSSVSAISSAESEAEYPWLNLIEKTAPEFQALSDEQIRQYREIWLQNDFVYSAMDGMIDRYSQIGGLSAEAMFAMYLANAWSCAEFTKEYYVGNERFLEIFENLCNTYYDLAQVTDVDTDMETMYEAFADGIRGLNELKEIETETYGPEHFTDVFVAYGESRRAEADVDAFFAMMGC